MSITNLDIAHIRNSLKGNLIGSEIYYHSVIGSTMNESKQLADNGCLEGTVVIAEDQQSGRGRFNRNWLSNPGKSITLSVILRPKPEFLSFLNMASTLSVVRTIEKIVDHEVVIKWPNDVKIGNKKVSGILIETDSNLDKLNYAIFGFGVNVSMNMTNIPELSNSATSLTQETNKSLDRSQILTDILINFDKLYLEIMDGNSPTLEWKHRLETIGKFIEVRSGNFVFCGIAREADDDGNLIIDLPDGSTKTVIGGEVTLSV